MSSLNLAEQIHSFELASTTLSVYYMRLSVILNDIGTAGGTEKKVKFSHVMDDCVQRSEADQYPVKVSEIYPDELRWSKRPYSSVAELHQAFERAIPSYSKQ